MSTVKTQDGIAWVTMGTNPNALILLGHQNAINNCESLDKATLVDRVNRKIAFKNGIDVPEDLIINKKPTKIIVPKQNSKSSNKKQAQTGVKKDVPMVNHPTSFTDKEIITITGKPANGKVILANRRMVVTGLKDGAYIGFLINEKNGSLQRSEITMQVEFTNKAIPKGAIQ